MKFIKKISTILSFFISLFSIIITSVLFTHTTDYKLEKLSYNICNYNKVTYSTLDSTILSISLDNVSNIYKEYYYLQNTFRNNHFVKDTRFISNDSYDIVDDYTNSTYNVYFVSQNVFSKRKIDEYTYVLDYNNYAVFDAYTLNDYNRTDFCFITEGLAKKILTRHGFDVTEDNKLQLYKKLYSFNNDDISLTYKASDGKQFSFGILGVLKSNYGIAYKNTTKEIGSEDFLLAYIPFKYPNYFKFSYNIDLKLNPYGNKSVFKYCMDNYSNNDNFSMKFKKNIDGKYIADNALTQRFYEIIYTSANSKIYYYNALTILIVCFILFFILNVISLKNNAKFDKIVLICYTSLFIAYGIVANFVFIYPLTTLIILVYLINYLFLGRSYIYEFIHNISSKFKKTCK